MFCQHLLVCLQDVDEILEFLQWLKQLYVCGCFSRSELADNFCVRVHLIVVFIAKCYFSSIICMFF